MSHPTQPEPSSGRRDPSWPEPQPYRDPAFQAPPAGDARSVPSGYALPPSMYPVPAARATNGLAIASLVCALAGLGTCGVASIVGAIMGHVARRQIRERGEDGDGLALAGIIIGWIIFALTVLGGAGYVILLVTLTAHMNSGVDVG